MIQHYKSSFALLLIGNVILLALSIWLFPFRFEENDDIIMILLASGVYTGNPEDYLVFINYILGLAISGFYRISDQVEWYTLFFLAMHLVSFTVIIWNIVNRKGNLALKTVFVVLFYQLEILLLLNLQFTTTAAISAVAGIALLLDKTQLKRVAGVALLLISFMVRPEATALVLIVASPLFLYLMIKNSRIFLVNQGVLLLAVVMAGGGLKFANDKMYQSTPEWEYYDEYNQLRGRINDNPNAREMLNEVPTDIHIVDFRLLMMYFPDPTVMDKYALQAIDNHLSEISFSSKISNIRNSFQKHSWILITTCILWLMFFFRERDFLLKIIMVLSLLVFLGVFAWIATDGNLKGRVLLTALFPFLYSIFFMADRGKDVAKMWMVPLFALFLMVTILAQIVVVWRKTQIEITNLFEEQWSLIERYDPEKESKVISFGSSFSFQSTHPLKVSNTFRENFFVFSGWTTRIPFNKGRFDSYIDLIDRHALFIRKRDIDVALPMIAESIRRNYAIEVDPQIIEESDNYAIVKFRRLISNQVGDR